MLVETSSHYLNSGKMWRVYTPNAVAREIERLPSSYALRILEALEQMAVDPFQGDLKQIAPGLYRRRVGDYRILFEVESRIHFVAIYSVERRASTTYHKRRK